MQARSSTKRESKRGSGGFSLIELMITLAITLLILGLAFTLLAGSLNKKSREEKQASILADSNVGLGRMVEEIQNAGFGLRSNGIVAADSGEETIRVRANLNALKKQTTSNSLTDSGEDVKFSLVANGLGTSSLVRTDINTGQSSVLASSVDDADINADGDGDGLTFTYYDDSNAEVSPDVAVRVTVTLRVLLPQIAVPGATGYQPKATKVLTANIVLRNQRLSEY